MTNQILKSIGFYGDAALKSEYRKNLILSYEQLKEKSAIHYVE